MNWFQGNITEAVNLSKQRNAIFVVYIDGKNELSEKLSGFIDRSNIKSKLESSNFVAIRIDGGSEAYMQFASIYKIVPLPSLFFIGHSGTPLEVVTGLVASTEDLETKIDNVLSLAGLGGSGSASANFISGEQAASAPVAAPVVVNPEPVPIIVSTPAPEPTPSSSNPEVVCENGVCQLKPVAKPTKEESKNDEVPKPSEPEECPEALAARVARAKRILEEKKKEKEAEEARLEREKELKRRKEGQQVINQKQWQQEQELKEMKENIRRDRLLEQETRQRILQQIAGDRAERAKQFQPIPPAEAETKPGEPHATPHADLDSSRIQFRIPSGDAHTHTFKSSDNFGTVRNYVKSSVIQGTGIRDFSLATTFPRREFGTSEDSQTLLALGLCPTAVILVISRASTGPAAAIVARSGGFVNVFNTIFWSVVAPVMSVLGYLRTFVFGGAGGGDSAPRGDDPAETGAQKRANEEQLTHHDLAKKRNLDRLLNKSAGAVNDGASTSKATQSSSNDASGPYRRYGSSNIHRLSDQKDSDEDKATWNGNSTQQQ